MAKKIIRLTESDVQKIVRNILNEQSGFETIQGSTSPERIVNSKVLTQYGLNANESNYKNFWELREWKNILDTFAKKKNLSSFTELSTPSDAKLGDFIQFYVTPVNNKDERAGDDKIYKLNKSGSINADIYYKDGDIIYKVTRIIGCQNGLLALARAMKTDTTVKMPNRVVISMGSEKRESRMVSWNPSKINNTQTTFNGIARYIASFIITNSKSNYPGFKSKDNIHKKLIGQNNTQIANSIVKFIESLDKNFADKDYDRKKLGEINTQPVQTYLSKLPQLKNSDLQSGRHNENYYQKIYEKFNNDIAKFIVDEYKKRIKIYLDENYPEKSESFLSQVKPKTYLPIGRGLDGHINGVNYGKATGGGRATKKTNQGNYELGK